MKHRLEEFGESELELIFVATRLKQAQAIEQLLDGEEIEYGLQVESFRGGFLGLSQRTGVFFYALVGQAEFCRALLVRHGHRPIPAPAL